VEASTHNQPANEKEEEEAMARRTTADKRRERTRCLQPSPICWRGKKTTIN